VSSVIYALRSKKQLRIYNIVEHNNNNNKVIKELKQKVSTKTQRFSRYRKRQNQYYHNKMFRTYCKEFYKLLREEYTNVKNAPPKEEIENFWKEVFGKRLNTLKKLTGSKTSANQILVWLGAQYLKRSSHRYYARR